MTLCSAPAHAGSWLFSCTGSGTVTPTPTISLHPANAPTTWTPPAATTGSYSTGSFSGTVWSFGSSSASVTVTMTATVKATWTHATGQTDTTDPSPTSVWVCESAKAEWSGSVQSTGQCSDGLGGENAPGATANSGVADTSTAPKTTPPAYWTQMPVSGGIVTLPKRTLTAGGSFPTMRGGAVTGTIDNYTVTIHAQPYNYHKTRQTDNKNGTISFTYDWLSTTGNKSDLTDCYSHERVTYPGSNPYVPPAPFSQSVSYPNPTVSPATDSSGSSMAVTTGTDTHYVWASTGPYSTPVTVTAQQRYEFNDHATGEQNVLIPGPDSTASIIRTISNNVPPYQPNIWVYSITKQGLTGELQLQ